MHLPTIDFQDMLVYREVHPKKITFWTQWRFSSHDFPSQRGDFSTIWNYPLPVVTTRLIWNIFRYRESQPKPLFATIASFEGSYKKTTWHVWKVVNKYWDMIYLPYCWWRKSCTTRDVWNPENNGIFTISTGEGFPPSTVSPGISTGARISSINQPPPQVFHSPRHVSCPQRGSTLLMASVHLLQDDSKSSKVQRQWAVPMASLMPKHTGSQWIIKVKFGCPSQKLNRLYIYPFSSQGFGRP